MRKSTTIECLFPSDKWGDPMKGGDHIRFEYRQPGSQHGIALTHRQARYLAGKIIGVLTRRRLQKIAEALGFYDVGSGSGNGGY